MAGPFGGALRGLMPNGGGGSMSGPGDWIYIAGIVVLFAVIVILIGLITREYLRKKNKK